jgi:hypothetical protein
MRTALLTTSLALALTGIPAHAQEPPVEVRLNQRGDVERGDRIRVYARTEADGYLVVLHAEPDGRIRVLFPLDPVDDNFVRGDDDFEIRSRGGREAFRVYESNGRGTVYAAFSRDPFRFEGFTRDGHWDYEVLDTWRLTEDRDPEAELTALVVRMTPETRFSYDLTDYLVYDLYAGGSGGYDDDYYRHSHTHFYLGWSPWSWGFGVSSCWDCGYWYGSYYWSAWDPWYPYWYRPWAWHRSYWYAPAYYYPYYPAYYRTVVYPSGYWYRGTYFYADGSYRYSGRGRLEYGRYTFKSLDRAGFDDATVRVRPRNAPSLGQLRRVATGTSDGSLLTGRRPAPGLTPTATGAGRAIPVNAAGRRTAPSTTGDARRTAPANAADTRRAAPTNAADARRTLPDGGGMTDGRRVVTPPERRAEPAARTPSTDRSDAARRAAPSGDGAARQQPAERKPEARPVAPATRRPEPASKPSGSTTERRRPANESSQLESSARRSSAPPDARRADGAPQAVPDARRAAPEVRQAVPDARRTPEARKATPVLERRAAPAPDARRPAATTQRGNPSPSATRSSNGAPRGQAAPSRSTPSARSAPSPSRQPAPAARPAPSRQPAPAARAPSSSAPRSQPSRGSGGSPSRRRP